MKYGTRRYRQGLGREGLGGVVQRLELITLTQNEDNLTFEDCVSGCILTTCLYKTNLLNQDTRSVTRNFVNHTPSVTVV